MTDPKPYVRSGQPIIDTPQANRQWLERELKKLEDTINSIIVAIEAIKASIAAP